MTKTTIKTYSPCFCGCGSLTGAQSLYKPGHDAKHVSVLLSYIAAGTYTLDEAKQQLPSTPLRVKLHNAFARYTAKTKTKAPTLGDHTEPAECNQCSRTTDHDSLHVVVGGLRWCSDCYQGPREIKIGRWFYPIVKITDKEITYTKRDGSTASVANTPSKRGATPRT